MAMGLQHIEQRDAGVGRADPQGPGSHGQELDFTFKCHWKVVSGVVVDERLKFTSSLWLLEVSWL